MIHTHLGRSVRRDSPIVTLPETRELYVFRPTTWEGITGLGMLALDFQ